MHDWPDHVRELVRLALQEDIGTGDITTDAICSGNEKGSACLVSRQKGVLAGLELAEYVMQQAGSKVRFDAMMHDGDLLQPGKEIARLNGPLAPILSAERTMLNFLQRMSGIATKTRLYAEKLKNTRTRILDTRKTVPGHRYLDKMAVRIGGGTNHRMRLDDRFLIKENHIRMAGGIEQAISRCINYREKHHLKAALEIEVTSLEELDRVLQFGKVDYVMLDNMSFEMMKKAVSRVKSAMKRSGETCHTEASGNVTLENLPEVAATGVDYISSGALTHSVRALDISLLVENG